MTSTDLNFTIKLKKNDFGPWVSKKMVYVQKKLKNGSQVGPKAISFSVTLN